MPPKKCQRKPPVIDDFLRSKLSSNPALNGLVNNDPASSSQNSTSRPKPKPEELLAAIENLPNMKKIRFPDDPNIYTYVASDLKELKVLKPNWHSTKVRLCLHLPSGKTMAVKHVTIEYNRNTFSEEDVNGIRGLFKEVETYSWSTISERNIRHLFEEVQNHGKASNARIPNIVELYGFAIEEAQLLFFMEPMDMSLLDLYPRVHAQQHIFPENILGLITVCVLEPLIACKAQGFIHRDLKPDNILIKFEGTIKLADFGESRTLYNSLASSISGLFRYLPPELVETNSLESNIKKHCDVRKDIWALGIVIIELILGRMPYAHTIPILLQNEIKLAQGDDLVEQALANRDYSSDLREFLGLCLRPKDVRPMYPGIQATSFYQQYAVIPNHERTRIFAEWLSTIVTP